MSTIREQMVALRVQKGSIGKDVDNPITTSSPESSDLSAFAQAV